MMFACGKYCVKYKYYETVSIEQDVTIKLWTFMEDLKIQNECVIHTCAIHSV